MPDNLKEFHSPFLLPFGNNDLDDYIDKLLAYREYTSLPVVIGKFLGFMFNVNSISTKESIYAELIPLTSIISHKQNYLDHGCVYDGDRFRTSAQLTQLVEALKTGNIECLYVLRGKEVEQVSRELNKYEIPFSVTATEWDAFEIKLIVQNL